MNFNTGPLSGSCFLVETKQLPVFINFQRIVKNTSLNSLKFGDLTPRIYKNSGSCFAGKEKDY